MCAITCIVKSFVTIVVRLSCGSDNEEQLSLCLEVLVSLHCGRVPVQAWTKSQYQYETFQKKLVTLLSNNSVGIILASLHLLAMLSLREKLGEKVSS